MTKTWTFLLLTYCITFNFQSITNNGFKLVTQDYVPHEFSKSCHPDFEHLDMNAKYIVGFDPENNQLVFSSRRSLSLHVSPTKAVYFEYWILLTVNTFF